MRSGIYWIKSTNTQYSTSQGWTSRASGMGESGPILLGLSIPFSIAAVVAKGNDVWLTYTECNEHSDLVVQYAASSVVAAVALGVLVSLTFTLDVPSPEFELLLIGYLAVILVEWLVLFFFEMRPFAFKALNLVAVGVLFWTAEVTEITLLRVVASPLLLYHTIFDLFLVDVIRTTQSCQYDRPVVAQKGGINS